MSFKRLNAVQVYRQDLHAADLRRTKTGWELELTPQFLASDRFNSMLFPM